MPYKAKLKSHLIFNSSQTFSEIIHLIDLSVHFYVLNYCIKNCFVILSIKIIMLMMFIYINQN